MFVSAPIPHLALPLIKYLEDEKDMEYCFGYFSDVSTTEVETGSKNFDDKLNKFIKKLSYDKTLATYTASFISYYFDIRGEDQIAELYRKIVANIGNFQHIGEHDGGILQGIFTTCLINDAKSKSSKEIPDNIKQAIKYIESEGFITHLEEKHG